jgi:hypothetical protein
VPLSLLDGGACAGATVVTLADILTSGVSVGVLMLVGPNADVIEWIDAVGFSVAGE